MIDLILNLHYTIILSHIIRHFIIFIFSKMIIIIHVYVYVWHNLFCLVSIYIYILNKLDFTKQHGQSIQLFYFFHCMWTIGCIEYSIKFSISIPNSDTAVIQIKSTKSSSNEMAWNNFWPEIDKARSKKKIYNNNNNK